MFHVRIRAAATQSTPLTELRLAGLLIDAARQYHASGCWWCELLLLMPDHLHALLVFPRETSMSTVVRNWKRCMARLHGVAWQSNFFDHRIRHEKERDETWRYIRRNPVAKGLCASEEDWPFLWSALSSTRNRQRRDEAPWGQGAPPWE
jgi:REP element-mobilizing transposase RayT